MQRTVQGGGVCCSLGRQYRNDTDPRKVHILSNAHFLSEAAFQEDDLFFEIAAQIRDGLRTSHESLSVQLKIKRV